jgi:hypothetical protein
MNEAEHGGPQSLPTGDEVTVPEPEPDLPTVNVYPGSNRATTVVSSTICTEHGPRSTHPSMGLPSPSSQPSKALPVLGVARNVIVTPPGTEASHEAPQSMPTRLEETVPDPSPSFSTLNWYGN